MIPICGYWDRWWHYHGLKWRPLKHVGSWHGKPRCTKNHQLQVVLAVSHGVQDLWDSWWRLGSQGPSLTMARLGSDQLFSRRVDHLWRPRRHRVAMPGETRNALRFTALEYRWIQHGPLWSYQQNYITLLTVYASPCWCGVWPFFSTRKMIWRQDMEPSPRDVSVES